MRKMSRHVYELIESTVGREPAETGGLLGGVDSEHITEFVYIAPEVHSHDSYTWPIAREREIFREWNKRGIQFLGTVHSHSYGHELSDADKLAAKYDAKTHRKDFQYSIIVHSTADTKKFEMFCWIVSSEGHDTQVKLKLVGAPSEKKWFWGWLFPTVEATLKRRK